jgi:hypothetical protein
MVPFKSWGQDCGRGRCVSIDGILEFSPPACVLGDGILAEKLARSLLIRDREALA